VIRDPEYTESCGHSALVNHVKLQCMNLVHVGPRLCLEKVTPLVFGLTTVKHWINNIAQKLQFSYGTVYISVNSLNVYLNRCVATVCCKSARLWLTAAP